MRDNSYGFGPRNQELEQLHLFLLPLVSYNYSFHPYACPHNVTYCDSNTTNILYEMANLGQ
jgi:hypothetical protein